MIVGFLLLVMLSTSVNAQEVMIFKQNSKDTTQPLIVVDGIVKENAKVNDFSPNDIQSISVLKGANATSKYGAKGEKGVIEVTTKQKAKVGKKDSVASMTVVVDGDHITINGVPADKNDPRIMRRGKVMITKGNKNNEPVIIKGDSVTVSDIDIAEIDEDASAMMAPPPPPPPPTNAAFLGVMTEANEKGAKVNTVSEGSPAEKSGLQKDDIILKVNDKSIDGPQTLFEAVGEFKPDDKVTIAYLRNGKEKKTTAVLEKNKNVVSNIMRRGFRISPDQKFNFVMPEMRSLDGLTGSLNRKPKLGISIEDLETGEGVRIKNVTDDSPAQKGGLKANDIIIQYDDKQVKDVSDLKWEYIQEGQTLKFTIQRGAEKKNIEVKIPKKLKTADL